MPLLLTQAIHPQIKSPQGMVIVPFKGCTSYGQTEALEAPKGTSKQVLISAGDAPMLEYFQSADGIRLLGPRGWHCEGYSGSWGATVFLGPKPIKYFPNGQGTDGPVIEYHLISDENSGRYEIAEIIARAFPAYMNFAHQIWDGLDQPFPSGPFGKDSLIQKSGTIVEFTTPAQTDGLGNFVSQIGKNDNPISGVAILGIHPPDRSRYVSHLAILSVRLPPDLRKLAPTIVRYAEDIGLPK